LSGYRRCIEILIDRGADVNAADHAGNTPLHYASEMAHHPCIELLLDRHANVNVTDGAGNTPLHLASRKGHHQCVEILIDRGANKSLTNVCDCPSIHRPPSLDTLLARVWMIRFTTDNAVRSNLINDRTRAKHRNRSRAQPPLHD